MRSDESTVGWQLDGVTMHVASTASVGVVNAETIFAFQQDGSRVWCRYAGGAVIDGFLLGTITGNVLRFGYVQCDRDGRVDAGMSEGRLALIDDGRIRMEERFRWLTREGAGVNVFEELRDRLATG